MNKYFQLVPFPDEAFRDFVIKILAIDVVACMVIDRVMKLIFCPDILRASVEGTTMKDVWHIARTIAVIGILMNMFLGDSDQWEELIAEEERLLAEEARNASEALAGSINGSVAAAVGGALSDEF